MTVARRWCGSAAVALVLVGVGGLGRVGMVRAETLSPAVSRPADPAAAAVYGVLETHCARCHQAGRLERPAPAGGFANVLDLAALSRDPALVAPGNPDGSRLYLQMLRRQMPKDVALGADDKPAPDAEALTRVREWIEALPAEARACPHRPRARAVEAEALARAVGAAGFAVGRLRFITIGHLHDACVSDEALAAFRIALDRLLQGVRGTGPVRLEPIDQTRTLLRLDLAEIGWTAEDWERLVAREGAATPQPAPLRARDLQALGTTIPLVRGDWLAHALGSPAEPAGPDGGDGRGVDGLEPIAALARHFIRPVHLGRAAADLGVAETDLLRVAEAGQTETSVLARRLAVGLVARSELEAWVPRLLAALSTDRQHSAVQPGGDDPGPPLPGIDNGPAITLVADKVAYRVGERLRLAVRAGVDCHVTVIGIDRRGRATVLYPSDLEAGAVLQAGRTLWLPQESAGYAFRLKEPGRERLVAVCNPIGPATDGIQHDFERQRFTDIGNYTIFLSQLIEAEAERRRREVAGAPAPRSARTARWRPPELPRARLDQVVRTGIVVEVRP